jgi:hypothetical protein
LAKSKVIPRPKMRSDFQTVCMLRTESEQQLHARHLIDKTKVNLSCTNWLVMQRHMTSHSLSLMISCMSATPLRWLIGQQKDSGNQYNVSAAQNNPWATDLHCEVDSSVPERPLRRDRRGRVRLVGQRTSCINMTKLEMQCNSSFAWQMHPLPFTTLQLKCTRFVWVPAAGIVVLPAW